MNFKNTALLFASIHEANLFIKNLKVTWVKNWEKKNGHLHAKVSIDSNACDLVVTGMGPKQAKKGLQEALVSLPQNCVFIGLGFCGALVKTRQKGELIFAKEVYMDNSNHVYACECEHGLKDAVQSQSMLTVDELVSQEAQKAALYAATSCQVVDMEAAAWIECLWPLKKPWMILKTVLDESQEEIDQAWMSMVDVFGRPIWSKMLINMSKNPLLILSMMKMRPSVLKNLLYGQAQFVQRMLSKKKLDQQSHEANSPAIINKEGQLSFLNPSNQ